MTVTIDQKGHITQTTGDVAEITGHVPENLIGLDVSELVSPGLREAHRVGLERWQQTGRKSAIGSWLQMPLLHADGAEIQVYMCLTERDGTVTGLFTSDPGEHLDPGEMLDAVQARHVLEQELDAARSIQESMLPLTFPSFPEHDEFVLAGNLLPAREIGGDFYDFGFSDDRHFWFCIGDVSGKGIPAALFMAVAKTLLRSGADSGEPPAAVMTAVNDELSRENPEMMFATVFLANLDLHTGLMRFTNAGHMPPYMCSGSANRRLDARHGPMVGPIRRLTYDESELILDVGALIFLYTDGVTEAADLTGELFGDLRLEALLAQTTAQSPQEAVAESVAAVNRFEGDGRQSDDITVLALEYRGSS